MFSWNFLSETNALNYLDPSKYSMSHCFGAVVKEIHDIVLAIVLGILLPNFHHPDLISSVSQP